MAKTADIVMSVHWHESQSIADDLREVFDSNGISERVLMTEGTGDAQYDRKYDGRHTIETGTPLTLDLADGTLLNRFGDSVVFASVKLLIVKAVHTDPTRRAEIRLDGSPLAYYASTPNFDFPLLPESVFAVVAPMDGYPVDTGFDELVITAVGGQVIVDIAILGASA